VPSDDPRPEARSPSPPKRITRKDFFRAELGSKPAKQESNLKLEAEQPEAIRAFNHFVKLALEVSASDLHIEPREEDCVVRYRVDGRLLETEAPELGLGRVVIARCKLLANMDMAERRMPQDGKIELRHDERTIELRVSIIPGAFGETAVLRILDRDRSAVDLAQVGFEARELELFEEALTRPSGLILATGPTGSGKTTTLYAACERLDRDELKLISVEDPIEHDLSGAIQLEVNAPIGLSFDAALRSALRHDPDVMLIGEIRDAESARIAIESALTGHLVLSSLHTREAAAAVVRLTDLGIEPPLLAESLLLIVAQRLLALTCEACREDFVLPDAARALLGAETQSSHGAGCPTCRSTGYVGRKALFEVVAMSPELMRLTERGADIEAIARHLREQGIPTLVERSRALVRAGVVAPHEGARIDSPLRQALGESTP
jgi:type II secretory ATPase GspE/PulE/Tfp pilus assembly ATPase PilB-like protein